MAKEIEVKVIRSETIKPSSPTPQNLRSHKLSLMDQLAPDFYVPLVLFYPFSETFPNHDPIKISSKRSHHLKETLSKTLTLFYPLAGRIQNNLSIECNDEGAEFIEARVPFSMSEILKKPDLETLKKLLPTETESKVEAINGGLCCRSLLLVQNTIFDCGGIAIGLNFSHKIADASTLSSFINTWAKTSRESDNYPHKPLMKPDFESASDRFPPFLNLSNAESPAVEFVQDQCVTRRFVFEAKRIEALQRKTESEVVKNPTRVEAVSAIIWKTAMEASRSKLGFSRPSVWCQNVNMRPRIVPPLAENVVGNLVGYFAVKTEENDNGLDLKDLVGEFRRGIKEVGESYAKEVDFEELRKNLHEFGKLMKRDEIDNYNCTSWCRFPFYELDFGWGKPIWVSIVSMSFKNVVLLMDTKDGDGIEAWLILREKDMVLVESNEELLDFASLNPSVV